MSQYKTKQREILLTYFKEHIDEPVSAGQIADALRETHAISTSAVYRNLAALEEAGKLQRISRPDSREAFYRYKDFDSCKECLHLSCQKCGKTFHLNHAGAAAIVNALSSTEDFSLDKAETILYGVCTACKK